MARCDLCFKEKIQLQPPIQKFPAKVCKGCFYDIDKIVGFLEHYGFEVHGQMALPLKRKSRPSKQETEPIPPEKD